MGKSYSQPDMRPRGIYEMTIVQASTISSPRWRAQEPYLPSNASKAGIVNEMRQYLVVYKRTRNIEETRRAMVATELPQRSRAGRATIVRLIQERLTKWNPPDWVLADLADFAEEDTSDSLRAALLLHVVRQDRLLYDFVQSVVVPRWLAGDLLIIRGDVQSFMDKAEVTHPEVTRWSRETREKLAGNMLTILRDYGLMQGTQQKRIVEPLVPLSVAVHLVKLLGAEGIAPSEIAVHPDWHIWLWDAARAKAAMTAEQQTLTGSSTSE